MTERTTVSQPTGSASDRRSPRWVLPLVRFAIMAADVVIAAGCFLAAFKIRESENILSSTAWAWSREFVPYAGIFFFAAIARLAMLLYQRVYRFHGAFSYAQDATRIFKAVTVSSLLIIAWAFIFRGGFAFRDFSYSRAVFVLDYGIAIAAFIAFHLAIRYIQTIFRRRGINLIPTLIVGSGDAAARTATELRERPSLGYRVVGVIWHADGDSENSPPTTLADVPVIGGIDQLTDVIRDLRIQEVIITSRELDTERLFESMMQVGREQRVEFCFAPNPLDVMPQKTSVEQIGVLPMVRLFREPLSDIARFVKRTSDIVMASLMFIIALPLWALIALAIKVDSRGPILFGQERVGMDGRVFLCYKFRTMIANADESVHREAYKLNIEGDVRANAGDGEQPVFGKVKDDPRITRVGKYLRRTSLDELPQLLNVLKGDMSVVGPRPPIPYEVESYELWHRKRLDVKPGITGLWQVSGRNRLTFEEMVQIDLYYVKNWSLLLDIKIILLTLPAMLRGDGAR